MGRVLNKVLIKSNKFVTAFKPNDIRLSFYIYPLGDVSHKTELTEQDLIAIQSIETENVLHTNLFDRTPVVESNLYCLLAEGVVKGVNTGADTGIYNYEAVEVDFDTSKTFYQIKDFDKSYTPLFDDKFMFSNCILADESPIGGNHTKVVHTFEGYLEVVDNEFSFIRRCDCDKIEFSVIYLPKYFIYKYLLRSGDHIMGTCIQHNGKMMLNALFTINHKSRYQWNTERPWFNDLKEVKSKKLKSKGDFLATIINKFGLVEGDRAFLYLTKTTQKNQITTKLMYESTQMFDKVIYININYSPSTLNTEGYNITKFCSTIGENSNIVISTVLLACQYAKRLIELGKKIAIIVDNIEDIIALDNKYFPDMSICKTLFGTAKVLETGSCVLMSAVSLRNRNIQTFDLPSICKTVETLGVVVDNNEIDLFNSYRI